MFGFGCCGSEWVARLKGSLPEISFSSVEEAVESRRSEDCGGGGKEDTQRGDGSPFNLAVSNGTGKSGFLTACVLRKRSVVLDNETWVAELLQVLDYYLRHESHDVFRG